MLNEYFNKMPPLFLLFRQNVSKSTQQKRNRTKKISTNYLNILTNAQLLYLIIPAKKSNKWQKPFNLAKSLCNKNKIFAFVHIKSICFPLIYSIYMQSGCNVSSTNDTFFVNNGSFGHYSWFHSISQFCLYFVHLNLVISSKFIWFDFY